MASGRKRGKVKQWLSVLFSPKDETCDLPGAPAGFMNHSQGFAVHNSPMTAVHGSQYTYNTTYMQGDRDIVPQIMSLLSQHIIHGAAHDDSAREPPPRCHPDTRVKLIARITAWFDGQAQQELFLWITGPAGVGKSAVVQTFAEYLDKSKSLGASIFISRPNKRNKSQGIFITIAYQLATRVEDYRKFIVERLSLDPNLLNKGMEAQFKAFIVEPFVEKKIGAGGKRWCIILDGLDELDGEDSQRSIIHLISNFVFEHRDAPLVWIIASRPESHISNTFDDDEVRRSCWMEYLPIDSTEACQDVERFLRSRFQAIRKQFRDAVPRNWPSDADFLKLTVAASGLFVYAEVAMRFIRDPEHADPVSRFQAVLSVIDRSGDVLIRDNPFAHLDALYKEIVSSVPSALWPTARQLLAFTFYAERISRDRYLNVRPGFGTLRGMSLLFGIPQHVVYACLSKCRSTLKIPDWKVAHKRGLTFLHASFADYLKDSGRSGDFCIGDDQQIQERVFSRVLEVWNECNGGDPTTTSIESSWHQYCSKWDGETPSTAIAKLNATVFHGMIHCIGRSIHHVVGATPVDASVFVQFGKVHMIKLCNHFGADGLFVFLLVLISKLLPGSGSSTPSEGYSAQYDVKFVRRVRLGDLKFGHLDWKEMSPIRSLSCIHAVYLERSSTLLFRPRSSAQLQTFVSELESLQERSLELEVVIVGAVPNGRVAIFCRPPDEAKNPYDIMIYAIPYPE